MISSISEFRINSSLLLKFYFIQIQQKLQLRIEAQGRKLQQMFAEQEKPNKNLAEDANFDILFSNTSSESIEDVQLLFAQDLSQNANIPPKIS